jgi:hypothetical protein
MIKVPQELHKGKDVEGIEQWEEAEKAGLHKSSDFWSSFLRNQMKESAE